MSDLSRAIQNDPEHMTGHPGTDTRFTADGELARLIRAHDWSASSLGAFEGWPQSLRMAVDMMLAMPSPATVLWGPARVQLYNDAYIPVAGDRHPAMLGRPAAENWPETHAAVLASASQAAFAGQATTLTELLFLFRQPSCQEEERAFDTTWSPIPDGHGGVGGALGILVEVTDRRRVQARLRESEVCQRHLFENWAQAVWETDADGVVVTDSPSWRAYTGQAPGEWLGYGWLDAVHPDDRAYAERQWREALAVGRLVDAEFRLRAPDGGWRWTNVRAAPVLDAMERIVRWAGMNIDIDARKRSEVALRESEARYRTLFEAMDEAYAVVEVLRDKAGAWSDFRFLNVNPAFMQHTSMPYPIGKTATELLGTPNPRWVEMYGQALDTGRPLRVQETEVMLGRTFDLNIFSLDREQNRVAVLFSDITERVRTDAALKEAEARQSFLLELSDALRAIGDALEIQRTAARMLGKHLQASRVFYVIVEDDGDTASIFGDYANGVPSRAGRYHLSAFSTFAVKEWRAGRIASTGDVNGDPRYTQAEREAYAQVSTRAGFGVPLIKEGRLVALLGVNQASPRDWTDYDTGLASEVAERTWAALERTRAAVALRDRETVFRAFAENSTDTIWIANESQTRLEYLSPAFERMFGTPRSTITSDVRRWADLIYADDREIAAEFVRRVKAGETVVGHYRTIRPSDGRIVHLRDTGFPIRDETGRIVRVAGIVQDVTDIAMAGLALEAEKERFRTLAEGIPQLVWRSCDEGLWTWASPQWLAYTGQSQEQSHGWGWLDAVHPEDHEKTTRAWHDARPNGELDTEYRVRRVSDGTWRWHQTRSLPVRAGLKPDGMEGSILEWLGTTTDIQDLKHLQAQQGILVAELQHRTRNLLAVVRNVARRSIAPSPGRDEYDGRLAALGRVQGFLSLSADYSVPLNDLLDAELHASGDGASDKVVVGGPAVMLPGESVQALALALHELTTNAVKYGAIGQPMGRLAVTWRIEPDGAARDGRLVIDWVESGVAMPDGPPARRGYGMELITKALPYQLQAETSLGFKPDGVRCRIALPASAFSAGGIRLPP